MKNETIKCLVIQEEKEQYKDFLQELWHECFQDPKGYEEFYFQEVYGKNQVYVIDDTAMLHRNPYNCCIKRKDSQMDYIVGVATAPSKRRNGAMKALLTKTLQDLYSRGDAFTFLMPAKAAYYQSFGFVSVSERQEQLLDMNVMYVHRENYEFIQYKDFEPMNRSIQLGLLQRTDNLLREHKVYLKHHMPYMSLLYKEKACQGGDLIFCKGTLGKPKGFFAYAQYDGAIYVEQCVLGEDAEVMMQEFFANCFMKGVLQEQPIYYVSKLPYMVRITNVLHCMEWFTEECLAFLQKDHAYYIEDPWVPENSGVYRICDVDGRSKVLFDRNVASNEYDEQYSMEAFTRSLVNAMGEQAFFFAEIV